MADSFRFVPRLAKSERELIVDGPDAGVVVRQRTSKRQRATERVDGFGRTVEREVRPAQIVEGLRRRRLGGPRDVEMRERFGGAAGFDQHHAEAQVRQHVPGRRLQLRLELTNRFVDSKDPLGEERGRPKVIVRTPDLGVCLQGTTQDHPRAVVLCRRRDRSGQAARPSPDLDAP